MVATGDGSLTARGTRFQVRNEGAGAIGNLLEGSVKVTSQADRRQLKPGEQARYRAGAMGIDVRQIDPTATTSWPQGHLDFSGLPLAEALAKATRYSAGKMSMCAPTQADFPASVSLRNCSTAGDDAGLLPAPPVAEGRRETP